MISKDLKPQMPEKKQWLSLLAIFLGSTIFCASTMAQDDTSDEADDGDMEEVIVTGSRIARDPNLASTSPVQSLTAEDIQLSGEFSISEVVNDVPALLTSTTSEGSKDNGTLSDGTNVLNLRGLGIDRTLVLVDGRRHVAGVAGLGAVDVGSIPIRLVERVEVMTGGASAIYGADAVTGVVNFIMKDDFEGFEVDVQFGQSSESDAGQKSVSAVWGTNFAGSRGNLAVALDHRIDDGLSVGERPNGRRIGSARDWTNPDLRFQQGDIDATSTPNFSQYYNFANTGLINFGLSIPTQADFIANYNTAFGSNPTLTTAEVALLERGANALPRAVLPERTFPFTSGYGYIIPGNPYTFSGFDPQVNIDLDGNGTPDCLDSFTGYNSVFGAASFGVVGGCWNVNADGTYAPVNDGLVSGNFQGFGGDSFNALRQDNEYIISPEEKTTINLIGHYEINDSMTAFGELKFVSAETEDEQQPTSFWDLLFGAADNPYLPAFIQPVATANGGVAITVDPIFIGSGYQLTERDTTRLVGGIEGSMDNDWTYELSLNWGKYDELITANNSIINDRFFAAIDAVTDSGTGQPACRVEVDPLAPAQTTPFNIPVYDPGYYSFTPGAGQCVPLNIWAGATGVTQQAIDWVTVDSTSESSIEQFVLSGFVKGDTSGLFEMPAGPIQFVLGGEYRKEESQFVTDAYQRGIIPAGAAFAEGTFIGDVSTNNSLVFRPALLIQNQGGDYDVKEAFFEASVPLLSDAPGAQDLTLEFAARFSNYSTIGSAATWKTNLFYQPIDSLSFRLSVSEAVRAPNISELFGPEAGTTFRPVDPCDINNLGTESAADAAQIQSNCEQYFSSIGFDPTLGTGSYAYVDPLSAAFPGVTSGNPDLTEETADTTTIGLIYEPTGLEGLSFTLDYWEMEIEDAIQSVSSQDIVNACYRGAMLDDNFCQNLTRSATNGGFTFLRSSEINFAKLEAAGYDFAVTYEFSVGENDFGARVQGSRFHKLNQFTNPSDLDFVNPELKEVNRPETSGNIFLSWTRGKLMIGTQSQYMSEQLFTYVEYEEVFDDERPPLYDVNQVLMDPVWIHDISASYKYSETMKFYGGIRNITDEEPFITDISFPVSPRGQYLFFGVEAKFQ